MPEKLRIMMVCSWPSWGGTEAYACRHSAALQARGHHVLFACRRGSRIQAAMTEAGVPCLPVLGRTSINPLPAIRLAAVLRRGKYDVIHAHRDRDSRLVYLASRLSGKPVVFTRHSINDVHQRMYKRMVSMAHVIAVSETVRHVLVSECGLPADLVKTVYPGIQVETIHPLEGPRSVLSGMGVPPGAPVIGMVNQLIPSKRTELFLKAAAILKQSDPCARYVIVGKGTQRPILEQLTRELGLEQEVTFTGFVEDAMVVRREFDIFVAAGEVEACSFSILEAMACALPVIAPDLPASTELVQDGKTGLLFPPGDEQALAQAIRKLLDRPDRARSLGRAGRRRAEECFSYNHELDQIESLYREASEK